MGRSTWGAMMVLCAVATACGGRVAPTTTTDGEPTGTTKGGAGARDGTSTSGGDSSAIGNGSGSGNGDGTANGGANGSGNGTGNGSGGGAGSGQGSCSVVVDGVYQVTSVDATGGGITEGNGPFAVSCSFNDDLYAYSFSATFVNGAPVGIVTTTDAQVGRGLRECSEDCPYESIPATSCEFDVSVSTNMAFAAAFRCMLPSGEDLPASSARGTMNVTLVPDTLK